MEAFKERLIQEYVELDERTEKLEQLRREYSMMRKDSQSTR